MRSLYGNHLDLAREGPGRARIGRHFGYQIGSPGPPAPPRNHPVDQTLMCLIPGWVFDDSKTLLNRSKPPKLDLVHHWKKFLLIFESGPLWVGDSRQPLFGWIWRFRFSQYSLWTHFPAFYSRFGRQTVVRPQDRLKLRRNVLLFGSLFISGKFKF